MPALTQEQKITVGYLYHVYKVPPQAMATLMDTSVESLHKLIRSWGGSVPAAASRASAARKTETTGTTKTTGKMSAEERSERARRGAKKRWATAKKGGKKAATKPSQKRAQRSAKRALAAADKLMATKPRRPRAAKVSVTTPMAQEQKEAS